MRVIPPLLIAATLAAVSCAPRRLNLPAGPGTPFDAFAAAHAEATARCAAVSTLTAELRLSGRAGGTKMRGRLIAGLARPASLRLEAMAPLGAPVFILAARENAATLLFPRDDRVVSGEPVGAVIEALTGVRLGAEDLLAVLAGCVVPESSPSGGRLYESGWAAVDVSDGHVLYLQRAGERWQIKAGRINAVTVEYGAFTGHVPGTVRLVSSASEGRIAADILVRVFDVELDRAIRPEAFTVKVPPDAVGMTIEELRRAGPLGGDSSQATR